MDIRSFFKPLSNSKIRKDVTPLPVKTVKNKCRKRTFIDSDSDDEPAPKTPKKNKPNETANSKACDGTKSKYFEVNKETVKNFLGNEPVKRLKRVPNTKLKSEDTKPEKSNVDSSFIEDLNVATEFLSTDNDDWAEHYVSPSKEANVVKTQSPKTSPIQKAEDINVNGKRNSCEPSPTRTSKRVTLGHLNEKVVSPHKHKLNEKPIPQKTEPSLKHSITEEKILCSSPKKKNQLLNKEKNNCDTSIKLIKTPTEKFDLWVEKYRPTNVKQVIGQQGEKSIVNKLLRWLKNWNSNQRGGKKIPRPSPWAKDDSGAYFKAALLSGPPGIGKTTIAHLVCRELQFDFVEYNASDTRSKKLLHEEISELLSSKSLSNFSQGALTTNSKRVLVMDEVDGMAGNEDRGGVQELISLIKHSRVPVICMCNDRNHPKIRSLANYCFDLRVSRPRAEQIKSAMMSVCFKEGIKISPTALNEVIASTNQDIRLVLNNLSMIAAKASEKINITNKDLKLGAWDVLRKVFSQEDHKKMNIHDKCDLFFHDYSIAPLFVQENYLNVQPHSGKVKSKTGKMELFAKAATSLAHGDLIENGIRSHNNWSLLPTQAVFSSLIPGTILSGHMGGQINFPSWLGKNSKKNKIDRLTQELQIHTRLRASGSKQDMLLDYAKMFRDCIVSPLATHGTEGINSSLKVMQHYTLLREDLESLIEITSWLGAKDPMSLVDSKVKSAFTRAYNKSPVLTPFSIPDVKKTKGSNIGYDESIEDFNNEELDEELEETDDDINTDSMIMVKKKTKADVAPKKEKKHEMNTSKKGGKRGGKKS